MPGGETRFLSVKNFGRMQHYKDRRPPWIKFYIDLLFDDEISELPKEAQLLYCKLLLVAGLFDNRFPANPVWISEMVRIPLGPTRKGLVALLDSGHLLATDLLADHGLADPSTNGASPRARGRSREAETEAETDKSKAKSLPVKNELATVALLAAVGSTDEGTALSIRLLANGLPQASLEKVRESLGRGGIQNRAGYAIRALQSEIQERT